MPILLVFLGGGAGAASRYLVGAASLRAFGPGLPWGTLIVNLTGGFAMGALVGILARTPGAGSEMARLLVGVGVLGGYTTFSSFSLETVAMIQRGAVAMALGYVVVSAVGAALCVWAGLITVRAVPA